MKTKLLLLLSFFVMLIQSCTKDTNNGNTTPKNTYYYLTAVQLNQTPYFTNKAFDTISYASDKGDTLTFVKTKTDTTWYCEPASSNPDNHDQNCYQTLHNTYTTIKGNGSFDVKHIKENNYLSTYLQIKFSNLNFYYDEIAIGDNSFPRYVGDLIRNNKKFINVIYSYNNYTDSITAISYINKEFGLLSIENRINQTNYTINK